MPKKLIIHIGTPKTGTSAIQQFMVGNAKAVEKQGFHYPLFKYHRKSVRRDRNGHALYQLTMREAGYNAEDGDKPEIDASYKALAKYVNKPGKAVVLSDEAFWQMLTRRKGTIEKLRELCDQAGFTEYEIVVYLRRQDRFIESQWNQQIKSSSRPGDNFIRTLSQYTEGLYSKCVCDYDRALKLIEGAFGKENVTLKIYNRKLLKDGDTCHDFLDTIGIQYTDDFVTPTIDTNHSVKSRGFLELKRFANMAPSTRMGKSAASKVLVELGQKCADDVPGAVMSPEERRDYLAGFEEGNRAIAQRYFGRDDLFPPESVDEQAKWEPAPRELERDMMIALTEILTRQEKTIEELEKRVAKLEGSKSPSSPSVINKAKKALRGSK